MSELKEFKIEKIVGQSGSGAVEIHTDLGVFLVDHRMIGHFIDDYPDYKNKPMIGKFVDGSLISFDMKEEQNNDN